MDGNSSTAKPLQPFDPKWGVEMPYSLSDSDAEPVPLQELLRLADEDCSRRWEEASLGYYGADGEEFLLHEVARVCNVSSSDVAVCPPQLGIYIVIKVVRNFCRRVRPSERPHAIVTHPGHYTFYEGLHEQDYDVTHWNPRPEASKWNFDLDDFTSLLRDDTRFVLINFPHSPTGYKPTEQDWQKLLSICKERDIILMSDEIHRLTVYDDKPSACVAELYENAISIGGLSKSFGLGGLRMGWVCTRNQALMKAVLFYIEMLLICYPKICQILGTIALRNDKALINRSTSLIKENLKLARRFFAKYGSYFTWREPGAGITALIELRPAGLEKLGGSARTFCERLQDECDVRTFPVELYTDRHHNHQCPDTFFRLGLGRKNLATSLAVLENYLTKHNIV